jgi:hypothetical protein
MNLNRWFQRRSGCASAEPCPALERDDGNKETKANASPKAASWKKNPFDPTIILLLLRQFSLILLRPRQNFPRGRAMKFAGVVEEAGREAQHAAREGARAPPEE